MTRRTDAHALWSLRKKWFRLDGCRLVNDRGVVCDDVRPLILNGYCDEEMNLTPLGERLAPDTLHHHTRNKALKVLTRRFFPEGRWYRSGEDRLSTYVIDVLIYEGDLILLPGGAVDRRYRTTLTVEVFSEEVDKVIRGIRSCSPSSLILTQPPKTS